MSTRCAVLYALLATCVSVLCTHSSAGYDASPRRYGASACAADDLGSVTCTGATFADFVDFALEYRRAVTAVSFDDSTIPVLGSRAFRDLEPLNLTRRLRAFDAINVQLAIVEPDAFDGVPLARVDLSYNKLSELTGTTFRGVYALEALSLRHNAIERIEPRWLEGHAFRLKELDLKGNRIGRIEAGAFAEIVNVAALDLSDGALETLDSGCLSGLRGLRTLDLARNKIRKITRAVLKDVEALEKLNLEYNALTDLDNDTFRVEVFPSRPALRELRLNNNRLKRIPEGLFEPLARLESLYLQDNEIKTIEPRGLSGMHGVRVIDLDRNRFEVFPASALVMTSPTELRMNNAGLRTIEPRSFLSQGDMRTLDVGGNLIRMLGKDTFVGLEFIERLDLSRIGVETIEAGAFRGMMSALSLDLAGNSVRVIVAGAFDGLKRMRVLNLTGNPIETIENGAFRECDDLEQIVYPTSIWPLISLSCSTDKFAGLINLPRVNLTHQNLTSVPSLCAFRNAVTVDLSHNRIAALRPRDFDGPVALRHLNLSANPLTRIAVGAFRSLGALVELRLPNGHAGARVANVANATFAEMASLAELDLGRLGVETIEPRAFVGLRALVALSVRDNAVAEIAFETLEPLARLERLDVAYNRLRDAPIEQFACYAGARLESVRLDGNLWPCDRLDAMLAHLDALGVDYGNGTAGDAAHTNEINRIECTRSDAISDATSDAASDATATTRTTTRSVAPRLDLTACKDIPLPNATAAPSAPDDLDEMRRRLDAMQGSIGRLFTIDTTVLAVAMVVACAAVAAVMYRRGMCRVPCSRSSNAALLGGRGDN